MDAYHCDYDNQVIGTSVPDKAKSCKESKDDNDERQSSKHYANRQSRRSFVGTDNRTLFHDANVTYQSNADRKRTTEISERNARVPALNI